MTVDSIFANGAEYRNFDNTYCCNCKKYVPWEESTEDNPVCHIEDLIAQAMFDEKKFPREYIKRDSVKGLTYCTEFETEAP